MIQKCFFSAVSFQTLNKNNLLPDERSNFYPTPLQQTNVYTTTYYPTALGKYDYQPNSSPSPCRTYNHSNNSWDKPTTGSPFPLFPCPIMPLPQTDTAPIPRWHKCTDMNENASQNFDQIPLFVTTPLIAPIVFSKSNSGFLFIRNVGLDEKARVLVQSGTTSWGCSHWETSRKL